MRFFAVFGEPLSFATCVTSTIAQSENNSQLQRSPALCAAKISFRLNIFGGPMPCVAPGGAFGGQIIFQVNVFLAFTLHLLCVFALSAFVSSAEPPILLVSLTNIAFFIAFLKHLFRHGRPTFD